MGTLRLKFGVDAFHRQLWNPMINTRILRAAVALLGLASLHAAANAADGWGRLPASQRAAAEASGVRVVADFGSWLWVHGDANALSD